MVNSNQERMFGVLSQEGWPLCFIDRAPEPEQEPNNGVSQVKEQRPYDLQRGLGKVLGWRRSIWSLFGQIWESLFPKDPVHAQP